VEVSDETIVLIAISNGEAVPQNDPLVTVAADHSHRDASGIALNEIGHQGLPHDEESGLIYNRARMLHPTLGRFTQRDPLEYVDGSTMYGSYHIINSGLDPSSTNRIIALLDGQNFFGLANKGTSSVEAQFTDGFSRDENEIKYFEEDGDLFGITKNWIKSVKKERICDSIILIGHSNGGDGAYKVAKQLKRTGLNVDLLVLLDPVQKPWHLDGRGHRRTRNMPDNVIEAINDYQRSDPRNNLEPNKPTPLGQIKIFGHIVIMGATMQGYKIHGGENIWWTWVSFGDRETKPRLENIPTPRW
jgi:RHS repeat-associated protein